ncbi:hypothetical protein KGF54_001277 [Candida jiufengensis]|uniref:uncharacterized protein n=1 Tax=Candida jiufengensis TaxID=497108 RepID=UPI0022253012|nr:uncharacterized protein KGF54_001277 [Candida jiufengensis]KAI5955775.1 hypothetical protein KGF54_001277 [Candida jiufengensis]
MSRRSKDLSDLDRTKNSPLAQLRLSNIEPNLKNGNKLNNKPKSREVSEVNNSNSTSLSPPTIIKTSPRSIKINDSNSNATKNHKRNKSSSKLSDIELKDLNSDSLDHSLNQLISNGETLIKSDSSSSDQLSKDDIKKAGQLASLLLDTRNILKADCNVIDPESNLKASSNNNDTTKITRNTFVRAEKVKTMLGVKYLYIERLHEWDKINGHDNEHPGVEGVYNPLQILRNRKIRAKYNEYPKPLLMKTLPLACNVFSRHNQPGHHHPHAHHQHKREWRMQWAIELNEYIGDSRWRVNHWDELKDPNGDYWFRTDEEDGHYHENSHHSRKRKKHNFRRRIHDRLFESSDEEKKEKLSTDKDQNLLEVSTSPESDAQLGKISKSKSPRKRIKSKVKKFYQGNSSSSSNVLNQFNEPLEENNTYDQDDTLASPTPQNNSRSNGSTNNGYNVEQTEAEQQLIPPTIRIEPTSPEPNSNIFPPFQHQHNQSIQDVEFQPSHKERSNTDDSFLELSAGTGGKSSSSDKASPNEIIDRHEQELAQLFKYLVYFIESCSSRTQYLLSIYPNYLNLVQNKINNITSNSIYELLNLMTSINDENLPAYEELYSGFLDETQSILHMVNEQYSMKIDTLLSTSDRSISEINASLSLDLRKCNERLDYLENSLFKNSNNLKKDILSDASNYKILYLVLENIIVILLKLVWVIVNIYKFFAFFIKLIWRIIRFFI